MTHSCVTWLIHTWRIHIRIWLILTWHGSFTRDMTNSCVTWLMHMWYNHVWRNSFWRDMTLSCVTWLMHAWKILIHVWHGSWIRDITHSSSKKKWDLSYINLGVGKPSCIYYLNSPVFTTKRALYILPKQPCIHYQKSPLYMTKRALSWKEALEVQCREFFGMSPVFWCATTATRCITLQHTATHCNTHLGL